MGLHLCIINFHHVGRCHLPPDQLSLSSVPLTGLHAPINLVAFLYFHMLVHFLRTSMNDNERYTKNGNVLLVWPFLNVTGEFISRSPAIFVCSNPKKKYPFVIYYVLDILGTVVPAGIFFSSNCKILDLLLGWEGKQIPESSKTMACCGTRYHNQIIF